MRISRNLTVLMLLSMGLFAATLSARAADIEVNGVVIPQNHVDFLVKQAMANGQQDTTEFRNAVRERLIDFEVVSQAAITQGLDKTPDAATALELQRQNLLFQLFAQDYLKNHPISEDTLKAEYDRAKTQLANKSEYKVRHFDFKTQQEAQHVIDQLNRGESWDKIAKEISQDPNGYWLQEIAPPSQVPPPFLAAVKDLKKGHFTETPVQTSVGWHVIRVDDIRPLTVPGYETVKPQILQNLQNAEIRKAVADLRAKAKIEQ